MPIDAGGRSTGLSMWKHRINGCDGPTRGRVTYGLCRCATARKSVHVHEPCHGVKVSKVVAPFFRPKCNQRLLMASQPIKDCTSEQLRCTDLHQGLQPCWLVYNTFLRGTDPQVSTGSVCWLPRPIRRSQ